MSVPWGLLGWLAKLSAAAWGKANDRLRALAEKRPPRKTIVVQSSAMPNTNWWRECTVDGHPGMQLAASFLVTNISEYGVYLVRAKLKKPAATTIPLVVENMATVGHNAQIQPHSLAPTVNVDLFIPFQVVQPGKLFPAEIALIDQFGNQHWIATDLEYR